MNDNSEGLIMQGTARVPKSAWRLPIRDSLIRTLLFVLLCAPLALAQNPKLRFQHLTANDGLSHNSVYAMLQDRQGFMWFGTYAGLTRYDGHALKVYKHDPDDVHSLSHNAVVALYEDTSGDLWIGTNGGLNRYDRQFDRFVRYLHDPEVPESLMSDRVNQSGGLREDRQGNLWIGTDAGVDMFDPTRTRFLHPQENPLIPEELRQSTVRDVYEDRQGAFWFVVDPGGLKRFEPQTRTLVSYPSIPDDPTTVSHQNIKGFFEDQHGNLWIATTAGLNRFVRETGRFMRYVNDPTDLFSLSGAEVTAVAEDFAGRLWVGTAGEGLNLYQPQTDDFRRYRHDPMKPESLNDDRVRALYYAPSGVLWIGTKTGGVNALMRGSERFAHYAADPENPAALGYNTVYPIYEDQAGIIWIGTRGGGLQRFDRAAGQFRAYRHDPDDPHSLSSDRIQALYEDRAGNLWIGPLDGAVWDRFDRETGQFVHYTVSPDATGAQKTYMFSDFYEDDQQRFWMATNQGLWLFDRETGERQVFASIPDDPTSLSENTVRDIYVDRAGAFWVATAGGLNRFDPDTGQFARYRRNDADPHSLSSDLILCLHEDRAGRFWVSTDQGLNLFDRATGKVTVYREKDGLPNDFIYAILEEQPAADGTGGNLWLSTNMGLSRFDPDRHTFTNYDERDGLQGNEFNIKAACLTRDGWMLFGGYNGLNTFYPKDIQANPYVPPVVLTDFQRFHESVPIAEAGILKQAIMVTPDLTLSYRDFILSFEFAALNFIASEKNRYRYRLEGFETEWNETGVNRRFVTYTNLKPGRYVLRVQGANNDGVWNEAGVSLPVTITPPWWTRWWFRGFAALAVLVGLFAAYEFRVHALQNRKRELEREVDARTTELRDEIEVRKKTERALRESEERFRSIVETTPSLLCITDTEKNLLYISPNCEALLGYAQHELIGTFGWWVHEDDTVRAHEVFERSFCQHLNGRNFEYKAVRKNGEIWYAASSWEPLRDHAGVFQGVVMQTLDITERKQAEQELQRLYEQTRRDADIKAELLREVNHRVGNNLTAIVGMLSLERRHLEQHHQTAYLNLMQDLTNRVNGLARVHDLLSASEWSPVLVHELAERVVHSSLQIVPLETHVTVRIQPSDVRVNADQAHHLALILNELATNSAKYAIGQRDAARMTIDIGEVAGGDPDKGMLRIRFQDDGPGYPDDVLQLQRQNVGLHLIRQLMQFNLRGQWTMQNDHGAVTVLHFPIDPIART